MTTYIAHFNAKHRTIPTEQNSIFIWQQESGEIDINLLEDKIKRESSIHFYSLAGDEYIEVKQDDIDIFVYKTMPFSG
ncbi:GTP-binding protein LepA [Zobellia laminariae]|uniref:GTP-binding protein LepA n=1 Tax=Zobellia barbeyronii TaxID=2748009 RepID=A0ABS5WAA1_9FLAO|nr:GTP-binding protein LepA [Zobellia barbeyronii]MBT2160272.1 GTP-binding protein LepA [Zobellia barbeyronii]MUH39579.1 GTP-binding protein LepA [Zobellia laminariae]